MGLKKLLITLLICATTTIGFSQTTLGTGDLWLLSMSGQDNPDRFSFVSLVDLEAGTEIYFSDIAADGTATHPAPTSLQAATLLYTAPASGLKAGQVVRWIAPSTGDFVVSEYFVNGLDTSDIVLNNNGDKIIAFQGTSGTAYTKYVAAAANGASYGTFGDGFADAIDFGANQDGQFTGGRNDIRANLITDISNIANWTWELVGDKIPNGGIDITSFNVGYYWDGATWTPSDPGGVGSAFDDDVIVDGTGATFSGITETNNNVYVKEGATLDIGANTLTADSVIISSSASGQGQVKGVVTGSVEFQSYIASASARWFNVGSPVDGALSIIEITNGGIIRSEADLDSASTNIYWYDTSTDDGSGEGTWTTAADKTPAANANGWSIYLGGAGPFGTLPMTISSFGTLSNGTVNTTISTANGGWNFINNPYAATIDWDAVIVDNGGLVKVYYIRDDENGWWRSYDNASGLPADSNYIPAGQAFFVQTASPTTVVFEEDQITLTESPALLKSQMPENIMLNVTTSSNKKDFTVLTLRSGASDQRDNVLDGVKRMNDGNKIPNIYTVLQGQEYVFKKIDNSFKTRTVPVFLDHAIDDELTISMSNVTVDPNMSIELEDKLSGDMIDLRQQNYTFRHLSANDADRFVLHLSQSSIGINEEVEGGDGIFAYAQGETVFVNLESISQDVTIQLFDMGGKMLVNQNAIGGQVQELSLPSQSQGVYLLKVVADGQLLHSQKIMK